MNKDKKEDKSKGKQLQNPTGKRPRPPSSPGDTEDPPSTPPCCTEVSSILLSINNKLSALDARISLVELLHKEFQSLRESLEFSQEQIITLTKENKTLQHSVTQLTTQLSSVLTDNKHMKESILDLQARSMRDNIVFSGIPEQSHENPEDLLKDFMITKLHITPDLASSISFHRAHRLGKKKTPNKRPRPIVAKVEHYKHKVLIMSRGRELRGTDLGINDQFPREIQDRRRKLFSVRKELIKEGKKAIISVDKLYVDGQLFRDENITLFRIDKL